MKKLVLLNGSARAHGNTHKLLSLLVSDLDKNEFDYEIINISENSVNYCLGCHSCEKTRQCVQNDDMMTIYKKLESADIICVAAPSYWGYVPGQLKVFFDRSTPYCNTINNSTPFPHGKKGIAIALRAGSSQKENLVVINAIEHYFSHLEIAPCFNATFENIQNPEDMEKTAVTNTIRTIIEKLKEL